MNPNGGAVALGHPSGARILTTRAHEMIRRDDVGLATRCIGVGRGIGMVVEKVG